MVKELQHENADILTADPDFCEKLTPSTWPLEPLHAEVKTAILGITKKEDQRDAALKALTLEEIDRPVLSDSNLDSCLY